MSSVLDDIPNPPTQPPVFCSCILFGPLAVSENVVSKTSLPSKPENAVLELLPRVLSRFKLTPAAAVICESMRSFSAFCV